MSGFQHGFVDQRSTETALQTALSNVDINKQNNHYTSYISLDFQGAFDNLPWDLAIQSLHSLHISPQFINIIDSFLRDRSARIDWQSPDVVYRFTRGCPQGSCLGPFLWLSLLESLLRTFRVRDCALLAYADDVLLMVRGTSRSQLEIQGNQAIQTIQNWADQNDVRISQEKSRSITFGKPKKLQRHPIFKIKGHNIKSEKTLKYLGVLLDVNLTFLPHLVQKREEITKITQNLYKFTSKAGRLPSKFLKIWYQVILQRRLAYACPIWFPRMWRAHGVRHLLAAQRRVLLLITRAYKNTSTQALQVLTGLPPLHFQFEMEAHYALVTRLGVSVDEDFSPSIQSKCSKYLVNPIFQGIQHIQTPSLEYETQIFTDGSKTPDGTGSAFCVYRDGLLIYKWRAKLNPLNSVFQAELYAIKNAILWAGSDWGGVFRIFSDSLSGIQALNRPLSSNRLIVDIQLLLQETGKTFKFTWVRGHSGIGGNEMADEEAKSATSDEGLPFSFLPPPPMSSIKYKLREKLLVQWQQLWSSSGVGADTKQLIPNVSTNFLINDRRLILFITNHGPFREHLFQINKSNSPLCVCGEMGNSLHYVLQCPLTSRYHVKKAVSMSFPDWFNYLLDRQVLLQRIKDCMSYIEENEPLFENPLPFLP